PDARAHRGDDPLRLLPLEPAGSLDRGLHGRESSWLASRAAAGPGGAGTQRGRPRRPLSRLNRPASSGGADGLAWGRARRVGRRLRGGARRVLELLLGAEQSVQDLLAQTLAEGQGKHAADEAQD